MEMGIGNVKDAEKEINSANFPQIRLYTVQKVVADIPQSTVPINTRDLYGTWNACTPQTVRTGGWNGFSAVGYFFGRTLYENLHVPIGLIHTSWGGTPAEAWTSVEALRSMDDYKNYVIPTQKNQNSGATLYNGMLIPIVPYAIAGAIWYQGESNAGRAYQYRTLLPTMIKDWRTRWGQGDFPFFIVQLANYQQVNAEPKDDAWAELREAQSMTADTLPRTGIAVTIDIGEANDIHPKNKQDVGRRLAYSALSIAYGKKLEYAGPANKSAKKVGSTMVLTMSHAAGMKTSDGGPVKGFAIAGSDHKFHWADAKIAGSTIIVSCPDVKNPESVRYGWSINPVVNLVNGADLPASPFRTDAWTGITVPKK